MTLLLVLLACGDSGLGDPAGLAPGGDNSVAGAPAGGDAPAATPLGATRHGAAPHAHASAHGGEIRTVGDLHVEVRFVRSGVMAWVSDAADQPVDLSAVTAGAVVKDAAGARSVPMASMGDHLHAAVPLTEGAPADAVLTLTYAGKPVSADFRTSAVGSLATHDHTALHGGAVSMWGDVHVEYRAEGGLIRFWVTNAERVPIDGGVSGAATVGDTVVPLTFDPATGTLSGAASPAPGERVMLDAKVRGTAFSLGFEG